MRDFSRLIAFQKADHLVLEIYRITRKFPREELWGLTSQMRRAALSIPSNIVEGASRESEAEFLRFLGIAYASSRELEYQLSVAHRLDCISMTDHESTRQKCEETSKLLNGLMQSFTRSMPSRPRVE